MAPITSSLQITNLEDGETIHQRCLLVAGTYGFEAAEGSYIHVTTKAANKSENFPEQTWPLAGGHFKALVMLSPGLNRLEFAYICNDCIEHTVETNVNYWPLMQYPPLHLAIMVASDSPCLIDCPPNKAAGVSSAHSDLDAAIAKLRMTAYMWQAMTAEDMRKQGIGRRSFRLEEEWIVDTVSREFTNARISQTLAQDDAVRSTAKIHVIRSSKTVREIRNENIAQQNGRARNKNALFDYFKEALLEAGGPFVPDAQPVVAGLILDSQYSMSKGLILGHAALGCHDPRGISLGMFGSHLTYSWPRFLEEVTSCLTDTRKPGEKVGNDNGQCTTLWEACAIGQGAHMHEVGHAFGSPHRPGIMERGYAQDWVKNFVSQTAYSRYLKQEGTVVDPENTPNNARWDLADALSFRNLSHFRLPTDPILNETARKAKPDVSVTHEEEEGGLAILHINSYSGIARITFNNTEHEQPAEWLDNAPTSMQFTESELNQRFDRTKPLPLRILASNGRETSTANVWKLVANKSFIRIPGSNIILRKHLAYSSADSSSHFEWAQLLRERGADGHIHRAVSIDLRVGCLWDGGVVKYADGHVSHWGPMRTYGSRHRFGGHASQKIRLPESVEITSVQVNPDDGVRVHLSNGQSKGELNAQSDTQLVEVKPAADEIVVGFFGKSRRNDGFNGVCEFGLICVKREVGWEGLPEAVFALDQVRNTAGLEDAEHAMVENEYEEDEDMED
ncbi:hypothetical protein COCC4DRAFT_205340 [Bipolaris maydis ATCC 48331]|uniref:Jacalin-type lectin domain-containing protein n=2 Tax=Cochliobolus heterostrophus TaxID=5016 RepID=M2U3X5_COCH5|nr:uncharacterized protein COCC4DRAFT_205340 [Bipolaris maydis ATCC 48331]EMD88431.1 hypothetical protein COCHEDRAFT_1205677 [Bipolaris maydis C5]KAH7556356.1 hypothetical protein BM1_05790 [Bipolaris maydis]ENI00730.1 hypothetical protein COCC4DRAFT_205340 [Bipolaris maydis ATCC 48331]KAJ5028423.1 putative peptidase family-domain-containing protein [Bipolaris maydis]KAJ6205945.1 metallopeptidase [Bipolaris maydis]